MQRLLLVFKGHRLQPLPVEPKVCDLVVGDKDITVMPAICDFTGLNIVATRSESFQCLCLLLGMVKCAGKVLRRETNQLWLLL